MLKGLPCKITEMTTSKVQKIILIYK
jgi:translation initiation factor 5A